MAKGSGSRRNIPNPDSSAGNSKAAGNGNHQELARNLANALKLDRQDSSELTPRSRASWASRVEEEEHQGTDLCGHQKSPKEGTKEVATSLEKTEDAARKSKKKKKKKNKVMPTGEDIASPSVASSSQKFEERFTSQSPENSSQLEGRTQGGPVSSEFPLDGDRGSTETNAAYNVDVKGRGVEVMSNNLGRIKVNNPVWALKRSDSGDHDDEFKAEGLPACKSRPVPSWQPVAPKDTAIPYTSTDNEDSGWDVHPVDYTGQSGGWDVPTQIENEDVCRPGAGFLNPGEPAVAAAGEQSSPPYPGTAWDEPTPADNSSNWDSGWEVAGSRRGKRGDEISGKSPAAPNVSQKGKAGRGQKGFEYGQKGAKQRPGEWEYVNRGGRVIGNGSQEKSGRPIARNPPGLNNSGPTRQGSPSQSVWGKALGRSSNTLEPQVGQGLKNATSSGAAGSGSILGKLLPPERAFVPDSDNQTPHRSTGSVLLDAWKGGFPAFPGNGSSVFDDYPASLYSDSQCSDDDLDSDTISLASFESDESHKSHTTQRTNKWFRSFFQDLEILTEEQLQEHDRQWHCPACQGGVGAIDWYRGLQPLLAHAKTVRSKRVKLHKAFAEVLEEEIRIRGAAPGTHGSGKYGRWRGLGDDTESKDSLIVWPPMVMVRNTQLMQDEDEKWIGMGNKELLDLFKNHNPVKARHAYGPQGHRGISILIFGETPTGYYNAQRLDKQFYEARRGKENWDLPGKLLFQPGGDRILYGYMATAEDLDIFNKHSKGKQHLKWEHKSLQEMVLYPMRRLDEENNKVTLLQGKVQREMEASKALKKTMTLMSKKLVMRENELSVIRDRAREQHSQQQIEMEDLESLYKEKIDHLKQEISEKEKALEKLHLEYEQEHMEQCQQLEQQASKIPKDKHLSDEQQQQQALVEEEIARHSQLVELCIKNQEEWEARKVELLKEHHQKMMDFKSRQWEELIKFELKLDQERIAIMEIFKLPTAK